MISQYYKLIISRIKSLFLRVFLFYFAGAFWPRFLGSSEDWQTDGKLGKKSWLSKVISGDISLSCIFTAPCSILFQDDHFDQ